MSFTERFIRRPVLSTVLASLIILLGLQGFANLQVREYPEVDESVITVTTAYPGASAELIQGFITAPLSETIATTENIDYLTSTSRPSQSQITVNMNLGADPDTALTEVMSKVQEIRGELPDDAEDPVIVKGTGQSVAIMYLGFQNPDMNAEQLTEYIDRVIKPRMSTIEGVAEVQIIGASNYAMRVWVDPIRLAAFDLTAAEVLAAINDSNLLAAAGSTENEYVAYPIDVDSTLQDADGFGAIPLRSDGDHLVRLRDVADVSLGAENDDTIVTLGGQQGTFVGIFPTPSANPLNTADAVLAELPSIRDTLPPGMTLTMMYDATEAISASIYEVFLTIAEAVVIVVLVILLFLGSWRSVLMPIATIPLSLIGVGLLIWGFGFSINLLTLLAMVLAIGLVVDDAIVVVENIYRNMETGLTPRRASVRGMREITTAVIAMSLTLAAVFAPLAFTAGLTGSLFREFALTLSGAVLISGIVALTITPMMSARLLKGGEPNRFQATVDRYFAKLSNGFESVLRRSLGHVYLMLFAIVALVAVTGFMFLNTSSQLAPEEDRGALFSQAQAPTYATSSYTDLYAQQMRELTADIDEVGMQFSIVGNGGQQDSAFVLWSFVPWGERERSQQQLQQEIQGRLSAVSGVDAFVFAPPSLPGAGGGLPISMIVQTTGEIGQLYEIAEEIRQEAMASGRFITVQNSLDYTAREVSVTIDRDRAAALGIPVGEISRTLGLLVGNNALGQFDRAANSYDVIMQVPERYRANPSALGDFYVRSAGGAMVPLSAVVKVSEGVSATAIEQFNQLNSTTISALPIPTVTTGDGLAELERIANERLPRSYFIDYADQSRLEKEQGSTILIAFGLALVVIYLVLAAQYESFRDPLIILMSVPLSIFGAILPLNLGLDTLNIYTQVGMITLIGIITKHGILIVEFANQQRREKGSSRLDAAVEAARVRLRPILMTTAAMVFAMVPLLIASGSGAAARFSIGLVIFAGLTIGTLCTIFVVPLFYTLVARPEPKREEEAIWDPDASERFDGDSEAAQA